MEVINKATAKVALENKRIFVTHLAGFIGANLAQALIKIDTPMTIAGLNNVNDYQTSL